MNESCTWIAPQVHSYFSRILKLDTFPACQLFSRIYMTISQTISTQAPCFGCKMLLGPTPPPHSDLISTPTEHAWHILIYKCSTGGIAGFHDAEKCCRHIYMRMCYYPFQLLPLVSEKSPTEPNVSIYKTKQSWKWSPKNKTYMTHFLRKNRNYSFKTAHKSSTMHKNYDEYNCWMMKPFLKTEYWK